MTAPKERYKVRRTFHKGEAEGEVVYELSAVNYGSAWTLPKGTVLEVVSMPKEEKKP